MLYIIEMMASDSFDNPTVFKNVIKIGYTRNFDKRIKGYYTHNPFFRIIKEFKGDEFDQTCEKIIHRRLANKRFEGRTEMFLKDEELMKFIDSLQTKEDILKYKTLCRSKGLSYQPAYNKYKGILSKNWSLIETKYTGTLEELVQLFVDYNVDDIQLFIRDKLGIQLVDYTEEEKLQMKEFFKIFRKQKNRRNKLKLLCESSGLPGFWTIVDNVPNKRFKEYINTLGVDGCKALGYRIELIDKKLSVLSFSEDKLRNTVYDTFEVGKAYSKASIKSTLAKLYKSIGYKATAKASDLSVYFELRRTSVDDGSGKRVAGFKLLEKLDKPLES
jgi:hypothetical protein